MIGSFEYTYKNYRQWGPVMTTYTFKIDPCKPEDGYGWRLRYFEDGWEIPGEELFVLPVDVPELVEREYDTARVTGELWVEAMTGRPYPSQEQPPEKDENQLSLWDDADTEQ
jgi:hypothetical protein